MYKQKLDYKLLFFIIVYSIAFSFFLASRNFDFSDNVHYQRTFDILSQIEYYDFNEINNVFLINLGVLWEPLFKVFTVLVSIFTEQYEIYVFILSFLFMVGLIYSYSLCTTHIYLVILMITSMMTTYFMFGNVLRQATALPFLILSVASLLGENKNKNIYFYFFILIGVCFHSSLFVFTVIPLLIRLKLKGLMIFLLLTFILAMLSLPELIVINLGFIPFANKLAFYISNTETTGLSFNTISSFILLVPFAYLSKGSKTMKNVLSIYLAIMIVQFLFFNNYVFFTRIGMYKSMLEPLLFCALIEYIPKDKKMLFYWLMTIAIVFYMSFVTVPTLISSGMFNI